MDMKISRLIFFSFLLILTFFSVTTYNDYRIAREIAKNSEYQTTSSEIIQNATRLQRNMLETISNARGYLLTGDSSFIQNNYDHSKESSAIIRNLRPKISNKAELLLLNDIDTLSNQWADRCTKIVQVSDKRLNREFFIPNGMQYGSVGGKAEKNVFQQLQSKLKDFVALEYKLRETRKVGLNMTVENIKIVSYTLTAISIVVALVVVLLLIRIISQRILQMTHLANKIAGGDYDPPPVKIGNDELSELGVALNDMANKLSVNIAELKHANDELDRFAYVVSHDLKAPLRGINNLICWIEEDHSDDLAPKVKEYLELMKERIKRGESLIEGILSYARINKQALVREKVEVGKLIGEIIENGH